MLLTAREMTIKDLSKKTSTSSQNITVKLRRNNLSESDLQQVAQACNADFESIFELKDTGKEI
jgi:cyanate lyase